MAVKLSDAQIYDLCKRYTNGEHLEPLANKLGIGWKTLTRILHESGVHVRDRSSMMKLRMSQLSREEKLRYTEKAHSAVRGRKRKPEHVQKGTLARAKGRMSSKKFIGKYEAEVTEALYKKGFKTVPQLNVGAYNIDISVGNIAVEIHRARNSPMASSKLRRRAKYLIQSNWLILYIWLGREDELLPIVTDKVVSLLEFLQRNPTSDCKYWVVRRSGDTYMVELSFDDHLYSIVPAPVNLVNGSVPSNN